MHRTIGIYVHVPFCLRRCPYCAFYSIEDAAERDVNSYPRQILQEFALRSKDWRGFRLGSVYFGGGTPSLLKPAAIGEILSALTAELTVEPHPEITLEANPGTLDLTSWEAFIEVGINRLSLGIQALDDRRLDFLGRVHNCAQAVAALQLAKSYIDVNLSADLMVGTPLETAASWDRELDELLNYQPDGISFYSLTLEEGTPLSRRAESGEAVYLPTEETVDLLLHCADRLSQAGYRHYEVSNWAKPGLECRHNLHYWNRGSYLGLGPSAHSFDGKTRRWNVANLKVYQSALEAGKLPPGESETLTEEEARTEWVYLKLRQAEGLDFQAYAEEFGEVPGYWAVMFEKIAQRGLGDFDGVKFQPNDRGLLLADEIAVRIIA